eukprot:m51a1_g13384 putative nuclear pore complex protein nup98-nup96 isoform x1 (452) ;mRNA; f:32-2469
MPWMLMTALEALTGQRAQLADELCLAYAEQLEAAGLWHWSIYVILHMRSEARGSAVLEVLRRHADDATPAIRAFLVDRLGLSSAQLDSARADRCHSRQQHREELELRLSAGEWKLAHDIVVDTMAPGAVLSCRADYVRSCLEDISVRSEHVPDWEAHGAVYLDYLRLPSPEAAAAAGEAEAEALEARLAAISAALSSEARGSAVLEVLRRHADDATPAIRAFLVDRLGLSSAQLDSARADRCHSRQQHREELELRLSAGEWKLAHDIVVDTMAPGAVLSCRADYVRSCLEDISVRSEHVPDWEAHGAVYLDYLRLPSPEAAAAAGEAEAEALEARLAAISAALSSWQDALAVRERSVAERSRRLAESDCPRNAPGAAARTRGWGCASVERRQALTERACIASMATRVARLVAVGLQARRRSPAQILAVLRTCPVPEDVLLEHAADTLVYLV